MTIKEEIENAQVEFITLLNDTTFKIKEILVDGKDGIMFINEDDHKILIPRKAIAWIQLS